MSSDRNWHLICPLPVFICVYVCRHPCILPVSVSAFSLFPLYPPSPSHPPQCTSEPDAFDAMVQITHLAFHQYFIYPSWARLLNQHRLQGGWGGDENFGSHWPHGGKENQSGLGSKCWVWGGVLDGWMHYCYARSWKVDILNEKPLCHVCWKLQSPAIFRNNLAPFKFETTVCLWAVLKDLLLH